MNALAGVAQSRTYRQEKKNINQVNIGKNGRKNWLVTGIKSAALSKRTAPALRRGDGEGLIHMANSPNEKNKAY